MISGFAQRLNALQNKIEHASTLSCCRIEDGCDERSSEQNSYRKIATPLSTPHWPTYAASLIGGRFLLMSGVIVLHLSFTATNYAYANDFDDAPQVKALAIGMPQDIAFFIARTAECNHWAGEEPYDKDRANYIRNAVEKAGCERFEAVVPALSWTTQRGNISVVAAYRRASTGVASQLNAFLILWLSRLRCRSFCISNSIVLSRDGQWMNCGVR